MLQKLLLSIGLCTLLLSPVLLTPVPAQSQGTFADNAGEDVGTKQAEEVNIEGKTDLAAAVESVLRSIVMLMGIAAVFVIVIVGIGLIVGIGSEESRARAIKVILYTTAGIIVIALASAVVNFVAQRLFG